MSGGYSIAAGKGARKEIARMDCGASHEAYGSGGGDYSEGDERGALLLRNRVANVDLYSRLFGLVITKRSNYMKGDAT